MGTVDILARSVHGIMAVVHCCPQLSYGLVQMPTALCMASGLPHDHTWNRSIECSLKDRKYRPRYTLLKSHQVQSMSIMDVIMSVNVFNHGLFT